MKKILVVLSMACFVGVFAAHAQSPASSAKASNPEASAQQTVIGAKENPATATKEASHPGCCQKGASAKACCKAGQAKACTPAEKAKCAEKMKAEAATESKENSEELKN